jgi:hypothetical protein
MQITDKIVEGCSIKELVWLYREAFWKDYVLEHLNFAGQNMENPEAILAQIATCQERLNILNTATIQGQIESHTAAYYQWRESVEKQHKAKMPLQEKCKGVIAELSKWEPMSESSKYLKVNIIQSIKCEAFYTFYDGVKDPVSFDAEWVLSQMEMEKKRLTGDIENLTIKYQAAIEYQKELNMFEGKLLQDLELLD